MAVGWKPGKWWAVGGTWEVDEESELLVPLRAAAVPHHACPLCDPAAHAEPAAECTSSLTKATFHTARLAAANAWNDPVLQQLPASVSVLCAVALCTLVTE